jgi:hypothetical protein
MPSETASEPLKGRHFYLLTEITTAVKKREQAKKELRVICQQR